MRRIILLFIPALLVVNAFAQDWYEERKLRFSQDESRSHLFLNVRTDLENIWRDRARDKEIARIARTEEQLTRLQAELDQTRWDNGLLNDVIDSLKKSADDDRLTKRDRQILTDDVARLKAFQDLHHKK